MTIQERLVRISRNGSMLSSNTNLILEQSDSFPVFDESRKLFHSNGPQKSLLYPRIFSDSTQNQINNSIKNKKVKRGRILLPPNCPSFFLYVKPKGSLDGTRVLFLYCPPFYALFDEIKPEMENLSTECRFYFQGRFLFIVENELERKFSIKADRTKLEKILQDQTNDPIQTFFLSYKICNHLPRITHLSNRYYNRAMYNKRFLLLFTIFNPENLNAELMANWVKAADPAFYDLVDYLSNKQFKNVELPLYELPNCFLANVMEAVLLEDDNLNRFKNEIVKNKRGIEMYYNNIDFPNFNERSKLSLHLLYVAAKNAFPEEAALSIVASVIGKHIMFSFLRKKMDSLSEAFKPAAAFEAGPASEQSFMRYKRFLRKFSKQPSSYKPVERGTYTFEAFAFCMKFAGSNSKLILDNLPSFREEIPPNAMASL